MKKIVYVGPFSFPVGGAASRRILGNAKSLQSAGYKVTIACGQIGKNGQDSECFEGIEIHSLNERTAEHLPRFLKHMSYLTMGRKTVKWLNSLEQKPHAIILYSGYSPYLFRLLPWAHRHGVKLVFDAVEWYDPASIFGWLSPYQLNIELAMRYLLPKAGHIISISNYLHRYYIQHGCSSINVPPTLDVASIAARITERDITRPIQLVYAGTPGRKDLLNNILEAVLRLRKSGYFLHLSIAGVGAEDARRYPAVSSRSTTEVSAGVDFLGVLSHAATIDLVRQSDFSLLLRHDARYSRAGFPTKFVESLTVGTPVIANLTSDLYRYLKDDTTGFTCTGSSPENLMSALTRAVSLTGEQYVGMRARCRELAAEAFDYRAYATSFDELIKSSKD